LEFNEASVCGLFDRPDALGLHLGLNFTSSQSIPEIRDQLRHLFDVFQQVGNILFLLLLLHLLFAQVLSAIR
jgi:hypothetical protein